MWYNSWVHWLLGCTSRYSQVGGCFHIRNGGCWLCSKSNILNSACPCRAWPAHYLDPSWSPVFAQQMFRKHQLDKNQACSVTKAWWCNRTVKYLLSNSWEGLEKLCVLGEGHLAKGRGECWEKQTEHERKRPDKEWKDCSVPAFVDQKRITSEKNIEIWGEKK